ncbi:MAG: hypothetical protein HC838_01505 [Spirulinaceae cyanobacterium RM2_2_10]|nr:hypothetical protein [Spirulinaceae cyanobacterium SM2_1_0]NJO19003.1 hypothetical protein [Spirulinaceae cyanobacterium RM2_2_10]
MKKIETEDYKAYFDPEASQVVLAGFLRLSGIDAYQPIMDLLLAAAEQTESCTVDLHELEFLNSSGISMLSMFVVRIRDSVTTKLSFVGSKKVLWQVRSLKNLKRLMPNLEITLL